MRKIYIYDNEGSCPVEEFFHHANKKIQNKFKYQLDYIKDEYNLFIEPHIKHFSIEKSRQLYELRIKAAEIMVRVIFYEHNGEVFLLYAFYKKDKKDIEDALMTGVKLLNMLLKKGGTERTVYIRSYLLTMLYNSRELMDAYYTAEINYNLHERKKG